MPVGPEPEDGYLPIAQHGLIGNAAVDQLQLDIYGELIDSVYLFNKYGPGISYDSWTDLTRILQWVMDNWDQPDAGPWEIRDEAQLYTASRLMCWVAIERMMRTARRRGLPGDLSSWAEVRDEIYNRIMTKSWDDEVGAFMQYEGADTLDAGPGVLLAAGQVRRTQRPAVRQHPGRRRGTPGVGQTGVPI